MRKTVIFFVLLGLLPGFMTGQGRKEVKLEIFTARFQSESFESCIRAILGKDPGSIKLSEIARIKEFSCSEDVSLNDLKLLFDGTKVFIGKDGDTFQISGKILSGAFVPGIFDGDNFKAGIFKDGKFVYGIDWAGNFMEGVFVGETFFPGIQWAGRFVPGLYRDGAFIPGIVVNAKLVPGLVIQDKFVPGTFITKNNFIPGVFKANGFVPGVFYDGTFIGGVFENGVFIDGTSDALGDGLTSEGILNLDQRQQMGGLIEKDYTSEKLGGHYIPGIGQVGGISDGKGSNGRGNDGMGYVPGIGNVPTGEIGNGNVDHGNGNGSVGYTGGSIGGNDGYYNGGGYVGTARPDREDSGGIGLPPGTAGEYDPATGKFMPNIHGNYAGRVGAKGDKSTSKGSSTTNNKDGGKTEVKTSSETVDNGDGTSTTKTKTDTTTTDKSGKVVSSSTNETTKTEKNGNAPDSKQCGMKDPNAAFNVGNNAWGAIAGCAVLGAVFSILGPIAGYGGCAVGSVYGSNYWKGCGNYPADPWYNAPGIPEAITSDFYPADVDGPGGDVFLDLIAYPADIDGPGGDVFLDLNGYPSDVDGRGGDVFLKIDAAPSTLLNSGVLLIPAMR